MAGYIGTKAALLSTTTASVGGDSTVGGDLTVDTNTLYVDSANNRVGVGNTSPTQALDVTGDIITSGGVYLGGTGAANHLDDYEEGTWTPTALLGLTSVSVISGGATYTKIGRLVHLQLAAILDGDGTSNQIQIGGLPFASANNSVGRGNAVPWIDYCNIGGNRIPLAAIWNGNSSIRLFAARTDSIANQGNLQGNQISTSSQTEFQLNIQYYVP